jgi:hypothetical protein
LGRGRTWEATMVFIFFDGGSSSGGPLYEGERERRERKPMRLALPAYFPPLPSIPPNILPPPSFPAR